MARKLVVPRRNRFYEQEGFRWPCASGTAIGSYKNDNGTLSALRPVYPGGSSVLSVSAMTCYRWHKANGELEVIGDSSSGQLLPPPGQAGRKAIRARIHGNKSDHR